MKYRGFLPFYAAVTIALLLFAIPEVVAAPQTSQMAPSAQPFDLSGVWFTQGKVRASFPLKGSSPLLPWGEQKLQEHHQQTSPLLHCLPPGVPRIWTMPEPLKSFRCRGESWSITSTITL